MDMSRYVTKSESCDWCHLGKCVRVCASAGASVTQCQLSSRTGRRGEQSDCLLGTFVYICCFYLITPYSGFLSGTTKLSFNTSAPPRQCDVLSSAIPGHCPQALFNPSGSLAMGTSNTSLWPTSPLPRLSPLYKWEYTSPHAVSSPPPKLHLTLSIPTLK